MSGEDNERKHPSIRFGDREIPTFDAWKKLEVADVAARHLEHLNERYPHLASKNTQKAVETTRKRLREIEVLMPAKPTVPIELEDVVRELIDDHSPDDIIDIVREQYGTELNHVMLAYMLGAGVYYGLLKEELELYQANAVSFEQIASLWNDAKRPVPGGRPFWDSYLVQQLVDGKLK